MKAVGYRPDWEDSQIASASYTIVGHEWVSVDYGLYSITCYSDYLPDLSKAAALIGRCLQGMMEEAFPELGTAWAADYHYFVTLTNDTVSYRPNTWGISTSSSSASMTILTFSLYLGTERTYFNEPYDDHTIFRLLMHELSHGSLSKYLWDKQQRNGGWVLHDSGTPGWVSQDTETT